MRSGSWDDRRAVPARMRLGASAKARCGRMNKKWGSSLRRRGRSSAACGGPQLARTSATNFEGSGKQRDNGRPLTLRQWWAGFGVAGGRHVDEIRMQYRQPACMLSVTYPVVNN